MWRASSGTKTFSGAYALMLAQGIDELTDRIQETIDSDDIEEEDNLRFGHRAFDSLTLEQKIWTLHKVAHGLLDEKTPACELTAFLEATVASIFRVLEENIIIEIDIANDYDDDEFFDDEDVYDQFYWRRIILNASKSTMENDSISNDDDNDNDDDDDNNSDDNEIDEQLTVECNEEDKWNFVIGYLEDEIFWDSDYDFDEFDDLAPDNASQLKQLFGVHDTYFSSIPDDPSRPDALNLLKAVNKLCSRVIKREEKQLKK
jgi:hypothetical protein